MTVFDRHPRLRWLAPGAALGLVAGSVVATSAPAQGESLPERSPQDLLVALQQPTTQTVSGTVQVKADLGLPDLSRDVSGPVDPTALLSGTHTLRSWYDGPQHSRVSLLAEGGESGVVRNGRDAWTWSSADQSARHAVLPAADAHRDAKRHADAHRDADVPRTPQEAAQRALDAVGDGATVTTSGSARVAGRDAYLLSITPKSQVTLVQRIDVSVDAQTGVALGVDVRSRRTGATALQVAYTDVSYAKPDASVFAFTPPPGAKVTEEKAEHSPADRAKAQKARAAHEKELTPAQREVARKHRPTVVGTGWERVTIVAKPAPGSTADAAHAKAKADARKAHPQAAERADSAAAQARREDARKDGQELLQLLPRTSGAWGSGRVLEGTLFSVVVTDDGRTAVGAVPADRLYAALGRH